MFVRSLSLCVLVPLSLVIAACGSGGDTPQYEENPVIHSATAEETQATRSPAPIATNRATLYVNGLGCPLCASGVDKQLERVKGVQKVKVDLSTGTVTLDLDPSGKHPSPALLAEAVEDAGFTLVKLTWN